jgi:hypothetical protein
LLLGEHVFTILEAQTLTGKLGHLAQGVTWIFHLLSHLYSSISHALSEYKRLLVKSLIEFQNIVLSLKRVSFVRTCNDEAKHTSFTMKYAAKLVHHAKHRYNINKTMHKEVEFFREKLQPLLGIFWETPIAHIILRIPTAIAFGNSCLECTGGYSIRLGFRWHLPFPEEVIQHTLIPKKDNKDGLLISINVLVFVTIIINYCASLAGSCRVLATAVDNWSESLLALASVRAYAYVQ